MQYKNLSLALLNALKVKVSASFPSKRWFMEFCCAKTNSFILPHQAFHFSCRVPCRKPENYWDCHNFSVRINPFLLLLFVNFNCYPLFCITQSKIILKEVTKKRTQHFQKVKNNAFPTYPMGNTNHCSSQLLRDTQCALDCSICWC